MVKLSPKIYFGQEWDYPHSIAINGDLFPFL